MSDLPGSAERTEAAETGTSSPQRKQSREHKITVASKLENLAKIGSFINSIGVANKLPSEFLFDIQVAVAEACTNVIEHAYKMRPDRPLIVGCRLRNNEFIVRIRHFGHSFIPEEVPLPKIKDSLHLRPLKGLGMFLMKKLSNRVRYKFDERRGNEILIAKRVKRNGRSARPSTISDSQSVPEAADQQAVSCQSATQSTASS